MDEQEKLQRDLERYRVLRELTNDRQAIAALEQLTREIVDRLAQIANGKAGAA